MSTEYIKTSWQDGDIITADKMNNIENGIKDVGDTIGELKENLTDLQELADTKAAAIYETASGAIASFSDGADDLPMKSCVVNIDPIQEGSGDPSPENVRPISGRTGLSVARTGKNLALQKICGFPNEATNQIRVDNDTVTGFFWAEEGKTYVRSSASSFNRSTVFRLSDQSIHEVISGETFDKLKLIGGANVWTAEWSGLSGWYCNSVKDEIMYNTLQIELGSTATDYEPYKGSTYSVNWETEAGTIYGGTLDVVSGKLTVLGVKDTVTVVDGRLRSQFFNEAATGQTVTVLGDNVRISLNRGSQTSNMNTVSTSYNAKMANLCPHYFTYASDTAHWYINNQLYLYLPKVDVGETLESYRAFLQDNPFEVYIQFATPTEIQLTPQEIRTLLGENNIWSDGGDVEVEYPADTKTYIDTKIAEAVAAAMA